MADGTLHLCAWRSSDNGFILSSGRFWEKTITLSPETLNSFLEYELAARASREIIAEDDAKLEARIKARVETLRSALV
jgi:diphthamide synthase subunit DPH2